MKLNYLAAMFVLVSVCHAELPGYYQSVDRVTWVVRDLEHVIQGWTALGLSDVHDYGEVKVAGLYRGQPIIIRARRISGRLGNLIVDMIRPSEAQQNAFTDFLARHGDGIFSVVHDVPSREEMTHEIQRMHGLNVDVVQEVTFGNGSDSVTCTYFDTEQKGKYILGLAYSSGSKLASPRNKVISHIAPVVREAESVSTFWQSLGFPAFTMEHAAPREDSRYRGKPLLLAFEVGFQHFEGMSFEWIVPPAAPPNIYEDFLKMHGEGIQHLGMPVDDLAKAVAAFEKLGYHGWQSGAWGNVGKKNSGQYKYMDTDSIGGVSVELIHAYD